MTADVRGITIREPWASCIAVGAKTVENRASGTQHRGPLLIHTSQRDDFNAGLDERVQRALWGRSDIGPSEVADLLGGLTYGAVIAVAELVNVHTAESIPTLTGPDGTCCEPWGQRMHGVRLAKHLVLVNVKRLPKPVPCRGALGLWTPPEDVTAQVLSQLGRVAR